MRRTSASPISSVIRLIRSPCSPPSPTSEWRRIVWCRRPTTAPTAALAREIRCMPDTINARSQRIHRPQERSLTEHNSRQRPRLVETCDAIYTHPTPHRSRWYVGALGGDLVTTTRMQNMLASTDKQKNSDLNQTDRVRWQGTQHDKVHSMIP